MRSLVLTCAVLLAACSDTTPPQASLTAAAGAAAGVGRHEPEAAPPRNNDGRDGRARSGMQGRKAEVVNPEHSTVVFLYYDLAGLAPPLDRWIENDNRVRLARPADKARLRTAIRAELESAASAVSDIGFIRLSMAADLSDYDPAYGEFTVRALAPSSLVAFEAFGQKISLRFANGRTAQIWRVSPPQAQVIRDKVGSYGSVSLDVLLRIAAVQPGAAGGSIITEVIEYEMRESRRGLAIGRVRVDQQ